MSNELQDDLDAYVLDDDELLAAERAENLDDVDEIDAPPDAEKANGMLRAVRGIERELRRIDMLATQEISRITSWRDDRSHGLKLRRGAIDKALEGYMRALNRLNPKRKTEQFPNGKLTLRGAQRSLVVNDQAAFMTWWKSDTTMSVAKYLRDLMDADADVIAAEVVELVLSRSPLVKIKPEPSKTGIKETGEIGAALPSVDETTKLAAVIIDGEIIPGVAFATPAAETFNVTL